MDAAQRAASEEKVAVLQLADERTRGAIATIEQRLESIDPASAKFNKKLKLKKEQIKWCGESRDVVAANAALILDINAQMDAAMEGR